MDEEEKLIYSNKDVYNIRKEIFENVLEIFEHVLRGLASFWGISVMILFLFSVIFRHDEEYMLIVIFAGVCITIYSTVQIITFTIFKKTVLYTKEKSQTT